MIEKKQINNIILGHINFNGNVDLILSSKLDLVFLNEEQANNLLFRLFRISYIPENLDLSNNFLGWNMT